MSMMPHEVPPPSQEARADHIQRHWAECPSPFPDDRRDVLMFECQHKQAAVFVCDECFEVLFTGLLGEDPEDPCEHFTAVYNQQQETIAARQQGMDV